MGQPRRGLKPGGPPGAAAGHARTAHAHSAAPAGKLRVRVAGLGHPLAPSSSHSAVPVDSLAVGPKLQARLGAGGGASARPPPLGRAQDRRGHPAIHAPAHGPLPADACADSDARGRSSRLGGRAGGGKAGSLPFPTTFMAGATRGS
jgi:hypothetical protein